jgi:hypothetical protein
MPWAMRAKYALSTTLVMIFLERCWKYSLSLSSQPGSLWECATMCTFVRALPVLSLEPAAVAPVTAMTARAASSARMRMADEGRAGARWRGRRLAVRTGSGRVGAG